MEENKILLSNILDICLDFKENPTEENEGKIKEMIKNFEIIDYMPLYKKNMNIITILSYITEDMDAADVALNIEICKIVFGLMNYIVGFENDLSLGSINSAIIDILYQFNIIDAVLKYCEKDYLRFEKMINDAMNYSNILRICQIPELLSEENMKDFIDAVKDLKNDLTRENLKDLKALAVEGDPVWKALKETVADEALGNAFVRDFDKLDDSNENNA